MSALLIDSGVNSAHDLLGLLPAPLRENVTPVMLADARIAGALRILATLRDTRWTRFAHPMREPFEPWLRIDWAGMWQWATTSASTSVAVRVELAASLAGGTGRADLAAAVRSLDSGNFEALLDALRIAREGLDA